MKSRVLLLSMCLAAPAWAGIQIDSNGIHVNVDNQTEVRKWKEKHKNDCSWIEIGGVKVTSDGCTGKENQNNQNRSVHGNNNPGKGHNKGNGNH